MLSITLIICLDMKIATIGKGEVADNRTNLGIEYGAFKKKPPSSQKFSLIFETHRDMFTLSPCTESTGSQGRIKLCFIAGKGVDSHVPHVHVLPSEGAGSK